MSANRAVWWKAWRELRGRFLVAVAWVLLHVLLTARVWSVVMASRMREVSRIDSPPRFENYTEYSAYLYDQWAQLLGAILLLVGLLLALGGALTEREEGTSGVTLALPVSRRRLVLVHATLSFLLCVALFLLSCGTVWLGAALAQWPFSPAVLLDAAGAIGMAALGVGTGVAMAGWFRERLTAFVAALALLFFVVSALNGRLAWPPPAGLGAMIIGPVEIALLVIASAGAVLTGAHRFQRADF